MGRFGRWVARMMASVGRGAMIAAQSVGKGVQKTVGYIEQSVNDAWHLTFNAANGLVGAFGRVIGGGGGGPAPVPHSQLDAAEALTPTPGAPETEMVWEADHAAEAAAQKEAEATKRALEDGMEPSDVRAYAKAGSKDERDKIAELMRSKTRDWATSLNGRQLEALANSDLNQIANHLANRREAIPGVPRLPFGRRGADKPKDVQPVHQPQALGFDLDASEQLAQRNAARTKNEFGQARRKTLEMEQGQDYGYVPQAAGMRR